MSPVGNDPIQIFDQALGELENKVVEKIDSNIPPPNAPSTIKKKKSSHTLIDTGEARKHVTHQLTREGDKVTGEVGWFDEKIAAYMEKNEFGFGVPERSSLRAAWDENIEQITDDLLTLLGDAIEAEWKSDTS